VSEAANLRESYANEVGDFFDFLDGEKPALFVGHALTAVLRTEPPTTFGPAGAADLVADWAEQKSERGGERISDLMLYATRSIVDAYNIGAIRDFKPRNFYRQYRAQLAARCNEEERTVLEAALDALQSGVPERSQRLSAEELAKVAHSPRRQAHDDSLERAFEQAVAAMQRDALMPEPEFAATIAAVEQFVGDVENPPSQEVLLRVVDVAIELFNAGAAPRAGRLFAIVGEALDQPHVVPMRRTDARSSARRARLNEARLVEWTNDPRRRHDVAPIVRFFDDLSPIALLARLVGEKTPAQMQLLLNMVDAHGPSVVAHVLDHLTTPEAIRAGGAYQAGLVALLSRFGVAREEDRRRAVNLLGPMLVSDTPALRTAAVAALKRLGGRDVVPFALRAIEASSYGNILQLPPDAIRVHLSGVMKLLVASGLDSAVAVVAEFATGVRDGGFARLERSLRDAAIEALDGRKEPLSRRAVQVVADALRPMAKRRWVLITGHLSLGVDAEACLRLMRLIEDSPESEAREMLELPTLKKLAARAEALQR
jgi:hypothetical protein